MDRGAWRATYSTGHKESDTTEVTEHGATHTQGELVWFFGFHCWK